MPGKPWFTSGCNDNNQLTSLVCAGVGIGMGVGKGVYVCVGVSMCMR